jgi:hypothetical protein
MHFWEANGDLPRVYNDAIERYLVMPPTQMAVPALPPVSVLFPAKTGTEEARRWRFRRLDDWAGDFGCSSTLGARSWGRWAALCLAAPLPPPVLNAPTLSVPPSAPASSNHHRQAGPSLPPHQVRASPWREHENPILGYGRKGQSWGQLPVR